jgi:hypothetical protein
MGKGNVGLAKTALEVHDIARATLVAPVGARPHFGCRGEGRELHVHVVRRAAHDAHRAFRQPHKAGMAATEVVPRPRDHVTDIGGLAALRVCKQAFGGVGVLAVELRGQALGRASELGMGSDVFDALSVDPDLALGRPEALEKLRTCSRTHAASSQPLMMAESTVSPGQGQSKKARWLRQPSRYGQM